MHKKTIIGLYYPAGTAWFIGSLELDYWIRVR